MCKLCIDTTGIDDLQTPFAKEVVQDSVQESFFEESPINPAYRQVVVDTDESVASEKSFFENSSSNDQVDDSRHSSRHENVQRSFNESQTRERNTTKNVKGGKLKSNFAARDSEESYFVAGKHSSPEQSLLNMSDPNESYQVLQKKSHKNPKNGAQPPVTSETRSPSVPRTSSPDDEESFQPAPRRNKAKARHNTIESSDEETYSVEPTVKTYSRQTRRIQTINSSDSEQDSSRDSYPDADNRSDNQASTSKVIIVFVCLESKSKTKVICFHRVPFLLVPVLTKKDLH